MKGSASAAMNLCWSPVSRDRAFSVAVIASTRSAPVRVVASAVVIACRVSGVAPVVAWRAQLLPGGGSVVTGPPFGTSRTCVRMIADGEGVVQGLVADCG